LNLLAVETSTELCSVALVRGPELKTGRGKPIYSEVVLKDVVDGIACSDHYGVLADLAVFPPGGSGVTSLRSTGQD